MDKVKKSDVTRKRILERAKEYILERGFKEAHIGEIASLSYVDRRTIYRYFSSKEIILIHIVNDLFDDFMSVVESHSFTENSSGFQKIKEMFDLYFTYIKQKPELVILLGMIDVNVGASEFSSEAFIQLSQYGQRLDQYLEQWLDEGQNDGSIDATINPKDLAITINNSLLSFATRTAIYSPLLHTNPKAFTWKYVVLQGNIILKSLEKKND
jgi:AcrR family transcriptional regulator